jgi:hypothetical protein
LVVDTAFAQVYRCHQPFIGSIDTGGSVVVETSTRRGRGIGWIIFAGVVMILAGGNMAINGLWALHTSSQVEKSFGDTLLFSSSNLDTWGWIYLAVGAAVFVSGILVFFRVAFAMWIGITAAVVQAIFAFFWLFSPYWQGALVIIVLDLLVIYALSSPAHENEYA